jgi:hypothetical protein
MTGRWSREELAQKSKLARLSRDKGARIERELVAAHLDIGVKAERVPLSGASRYQGNSADVDIYPWGRDGPPLCCQVKARASGEGFATLERWLGDADVLFLRRDRAEAMAVLPWSTWTRLVPGMQWAGNGHAGRAGGRTVALPAAEAPDILPANGGPAAPAGKPGGAGSRWPMEMVAMADPTAEIVPAEGLAPPQPEVLPSVLVEAFSTKLLLAALDQPQVQQKLVAILRRQLRSNPHALG